MGGEAGQTVIEPFCPRERGGAGTLVRNFHTLGYRLTDKPPPLGHCAIRHLAGGVTMAARSLCCLCPPPNQEPSMRRHLSAALCLCAPLWTALVGACSPGDFPSDGSLETSSDAIINGVEDTTHQAVVAYLHGAKCSATIIAVDGNIGYALTAAHCIDNTAGVLRQGNNHNSGYIEYPVIDRMPHPEYVNAGLFDFAMLKFSGATAATPVIAPLPAAQDNLTSGKQLTLVGYGLTQNGNTSVRHSIKRHLNYATALRLNFSQMTGGMCSGDSGGAALYTVGGSEYVAGVHAFVSGDCTTSGTSVRVSAVLDTFIMPYINGGSSKPQNCAQCSDAHIFDGGCTDHVTTCLNNNDCNAYVNCLQGCNSAGCNVTCGNDHAAGKVLYDAVYSCVCTGPCSNECVDDVQCAPPASCGLTSSNSKCQTCLEASCCAEA
ncbi:MAG TPA: hypothetical protein ENK23_04840, partial [Sorangium sp.]|nr:hypothetical protein [Sorangium sp.]